MLMGLCVSGPDSAILLPMTIKQVERLTNVVRECDSPGAIPFFRIDEVSLAFGFDGRFG